MQKNDTKPLLILASQSPRRKYLLEQAGLSFTIIPSDVDEESIRLSDPETYVKTLSKAKADDISNRFPESWVIGADTIVLINNRILGKPNDRSQAETMLKQLSGQTHHVYTGYTICCKTKKKEITDVVKTGVVFKKLTHDEIQWYIRTDEPFDKAGAYAIQGLGTFLVKKINGSYTNVVGLPVCEVIETLIKEKVVRMDANNTKELLF